MKNKDKPAHHPIPPGALVFCRRAEGQGGSITFARRAWTFREQARRVDPKDPCNSCSNCQHRPTR